MMRLVSAAFGLAAAAFLILPALADATPPAAAVAPPQRVKGTIQSFDAATRTLAVTTADHKALSIALLPNARVVYDQKRSLADIKPGDFVGAAALKGTDGKLHAQEVHIFPDSMRGVGEGQYAMGDAGSSRSMTNATVAEVAGVAASSHSLKLTYHGAAAAADGACSGRANTPGSTGCSGDTEIQVATGVPVIALMLGDETLLVPGAAISALAITVAGGKLVTPAVTVEKDGVKPIL